MQPTRLAEWEVLTFARGMNEEAALSSISMGAPQVMGFNHGRVGFASALEMFEAFGRSEREQIFGLFDFHPRTGRLVANGLGVEAP